MTTSSPYGWLFLQRSIRQQVASKEVRVVRPIEQRAGARMGWTRVVEGSKYQHVLEALQSRRVAIKHSSRPAQTPPSPSLTATNK